MRQVGGRVAWGLVALWALSGCGGEPAAEGGKGGEAKVAEARTPARLPVVETIKIEPMDFTSEIELVGQVEADETVTVASEIPGRVVSVEVEEGQRVGAGARLARLDVRVDQARAGQFRANLTQSERDLARAQELLKKGLATEADVERARLAVENNRYNLRMTSLGVGKSVVGAPIEGVVDRRHIEPGEYANPGQPLVTLVNFDKVTVMAGLPESRVRYAQEGATVKVRIPAMDVEREGRIKRVGIQADTKNRTFPVEIEVDNADHKIRPGMRARVTLPGQQVQGALLVPRDVVIDTLDGRVVYVVTGGQAERREVTLGPDQDDYVVLVTGVAAGDELVRVGHQSLPRKSAVDVVKTRSCCRAEVGGEAAP